MIPILYSMFPEWYRHASHRCARSEAYVGRSVTRPVLQSLVTALTLSRLDYGCYGWSTCKADEYRPHALDSHVFPLLHWLRVLQRIEFRRLVSPYSPTAALTAQRRSISLMGYSELSTSARVVGCVVRRRRYFTFHGRIIKQSVIGPSPSLPQRSGTVCRRR